MLEGVDLAPAMIEKAPPRGIYDALEVVDAVERLARTRGAFDLILAADTLPYLGDLAPAFAACRGALAPDGLFVFTAETIDGDGFRLLDGLRFAHATSYVGAALRAAGFRLVHLRRAWARREAEAEAPGLIGAAEAA